MSDVVIVSAARTPVGSFNGSFSGMRAADLGSIAIKEAINRAKIKTSDVSEVIMGQGLQHLVGKILQGKLLSKLEYQMKLLL